MAGFTVRSVRFCLQSHKNNSMAVSLTNKSQTQKSKLSYSVKSQVNLHLLLFKKKIMLFIQYNQLKRHSKKGYTLVSYMNYMVIDGG